jgi:hypothetical protein
MATFDLPSSLMPATMEWGSIKAGVQHRSPFNGSVESVEFPGERWRASLSFNLGTPDMAAQAEAFFARVAGGSERVRLRHFLRPAPMGSMRGAPTLNASAARGDLQLLINTTGTLKAGDFFKVGGQLFQAFADCSPSGSVLLMKRTEPAPASMYPRRVPGFFADLKRENWGMYEGRMVCCDYGVSNLVSCGMTAGTSAAKWCALDVYGFVPDVAK